MGQVPAPAAPPPPAPPPAFGTPSFSRPDDATRQAQLDAMKRRATGPLALAATGFVAASAVEAPDPWLCLLRATGQTPPVRAAAGWVARTPPGGHPPRPP